MHNIVVLGFQLNPDGSMKDELIERLTVALNLEVVSNAAWKAPSGTLSAMFQAGALIELFGDVETAFDIYYDNYDIHALPALNG